MFSGEWRHSYRYEGQLREAFKEIALRPLLAEHLIAAAEHLYFTRPERTRLLTLITAWLQERFAVQQPATADADLPLRIEAVN